MHNTIPKVFISYAWEQPAHQEWVRQLASRLRTDGVDVTLDRWHLQPGDQLPAFMEAAVRDNDFVLIVCTPKYKERSDRRVGGVGYEGDIITAEVLNYRNEKKFLPLFRSGQSWTEAAPSWLLGSLYLDFRGDNYSEESYRELLRTLLGRRESAPVLGEAPRWSSPRAYAVTPRLRGPLLGRDSESSRLLALLLAPETQSFVGLSGPPGVGKTALASHVAQHPRVLAKFHDGVAWIGLGRNVDPNAVLLSLASFSGISDSLFVSLDSIESRSRAVRQALAGKRCLVVLDDAWDLESIRLSALGGVQCIHLVTTRSPLLARQVAQTASLPIPELSVDASIRLFASVAPEAIAVAEREAQEVLTQVGGLPLAIILIGQFVGAEAHSNQPRRIRAALTRMADPSARLNLTGLKDLIRPDGVENAQLSLNRVIRMSFEALSPTLQQGLAALALFNPKPNSFSEVAAERVALLTCEAIDQLNGSGLLESVSAGRFSLHQAIHDFVVVNAEVGNAAYERFVAYYDELLKNYGRDTHAIDIELSNVVKAFDICFDRQLQERVLSCANNLFRIRRAPWFLSSCRKAVRTGAIACDLKRRARICPPSAKSRAMHLPTPCC